MSKFTPTFRDGQAIQPRHGDRVVNGRALGDSYLGTDWRGRPCEVVRWAHDASSCDTHVCGPSPVSCLVAAEQRPLPEWLRRRRGER